MWFGWDTPTSTTSDKGYTMAKTWEEKYHNGKSAKVEKLEKAAAGMKPGQRMLIGTPAMYDAYIRAIPAGQFTTINTLRNDLALEAGADVTCPLTTGIFLRIVAERAWDQHLAGQSREEITPFWRVIEPTSPLAKKLRCGPAFIANQQRQELH